MAMVRQLHSSELDGLVRLFITEGVPYAFENTPLLFEAIRDWLSRELSIHPKEVTLIGSARVGYSLAPPPDYGRPFGEHSDLDFSVISASLFLACKLAFERWKADFSLGSVMPRGPREKALWNANAVVISKTILRGFIDPNKVPTFNGYPIIQRISQSMWLLKQKLEASESKLSFRKASVRVYSSWPAFLNQLRLNISQTLR